MYKLLCKKRVIITTLSLKDYINMSNKVDINRTYSKLIL